jgi:cystathionine beta-synthase
MPQDENSYYKMAERLSKEIPGAFYANQNYNLDNSDAHYLSTGPEIWEQTQGKITWLVGAASTGGTLCGSGRFLREQNPNLKIIGVDAFGSVLKKYHETGIYDQNEIYPYRIEGTGKNILPANMDFGLIDRFVKVTDKDSALCARAIAREEGMLVGYSSGAALQALEQIRTEIKEDDVVVLLFSDHGSKYVTKVFSDKWMISQGFMEETEITKTT